MALTNAQRQAKWRNKNRVIYNLRRRNARKRFSGVPSQADQARESDVRHGENPATNPIGRAVNSGQLGDSRGVTEPFTTKKVGELRMIVMPAQTVDNAATLTVVKPLIFRDDYGRVISERAWNMLQKKKEDAKKGGYVIDDYSQ